MSSWMILLTYCHLILITNIIRVFRLFLMLSLHHRVFNQQIPEPPPATDLSPGPDTGSQNKQILKTLLWTSPQSCLLMLLILTMFIVCVVTDMFNLKFNPSSIAPMTLIKYGAVYSPLVNAGQYFRLLTAVLLHAGALHLFANGTSFFMYLMPVERRTPSKALYCAVLVMGGVMGNMLSLSARGQMGQSLLGVGASTSICSVIGFDCAWRVLRVDGAPTGGRRILGTLGYVFLLSMLPGIDFYGHFGGLAAGLLLGLGFLQGNSEAFTFKNRRVIKIGGLVLLVGYFVGLCVWVSRFYTG